MENVGEKIKRRRVAKDVHQAYLALALGRSQGWVSLVERGVVVPDKEFVKKIFSAIDKIAALRQGGASAVQQIAEAVEQFASVRLPSRVRMANRAVKSV